MIFNNNFQTLDNAILKLIENPEICKKNALTREAYFLSGISNSIPFLVK